MSKTFKTYLNESEFQTNNILIKNMLSDINVMSDFVTINNGKITVGAQIVNFGGTYSDNFSDDWSAYKRAGERCVENGKLILQFDSVDNTFDITDMKLTTMEGCPHNVYEFYARNNNLTSIEFIPRNTKGKLSLEENPIKSLIGISDLVDSVKIFGLTWSNITEGGIGLIFINNLGLLVESGRLLLPEPFEIISKYLEDPDSIYDCQEELVNAGFEEYAEL